MVEFPLQRIRLVLCRPPVLLALIFYTIFSLLMLPLRLAGIAVSGVLDLLSALSHLPARLIGGPARSSYSRRTARASGGS